MRRSASQVVAFVVGLSWLGGCVSAGETEVVASAALAIAHGPARTAVETRELSAFDRAVDPRALPTTFASLVKALEAKTGGFGSVMFVPAGRSLVRNATTLTEPRVVATVFTGDGASVPAGGAVTNASGLFLGFSKAASVVEIIAYDERAGRYDFEIIEGFGTPSAKLVRADRDMCTACHKLGTPIFPVGLWQESLDHNPALLASAQAAMREAGHSTTQYEGFDLPTEAVADFRGPGQDFEEAAVDAHKRLVTNDVWATACRDTPACRVALVKYAFYTRAELWNQGIAKRESLPSYPASRELVTKLLRERMAGKIEYKSPTLADRDPIATPTVDADHDPLQATAGVVGVYSEARGDDLLAAASGSQFVGAVFTERDAALFREALLARSEATTAEKLEAMAASWSTLSWATENGPLRRCDVLKSLLTGEVPGCVVDASLSAPPLTAVGDGPDDAELAPFRTYCASCHGSGTVSPRFLAPASSVAEARASFRTWAHCIAPVLEWREGARQMPPVDSAKHRELAEHDDVRFHMRNHALVAAEEARALAAAGRAPAAPKCPSEAP